MRLITLRRAIAILAFIVGVILSAPSIASRMKSSSDCTVAGVEEESDGKRSVSYAGVSFSYDSSLASEVKAEVLPANILQSESDKPEGISPRHTAFTFVGPYASRHGSSFFSPEIHIYPIARYKEALAASKSYVRQLEDDVRSLKSMLSRRLTSLKEEVPFLPFGLDASQSFRAHVKYVDFRNGKGIMFLTQYDIEPSLINDSGLVYVFQGLTDDGVNYVSATFPVSAPPLRLPKAYEVGSYEGYTLPAYFYGKDAKLNEKNYRAYRGTMVRRLEDLTPDKFEPALMLFKELVRSLSVQGQSNGMQRTRNQQASKPQSPVRAADAGR